MPSDIGPDFDESDSDDSDSEMRCSPSCASKGGCLGGSAGVVAASGSVGGVGDGFGLRVENPQGVIEVGTEEKSGE